MRVKSQDIIKLFFVGIILFVSINCIKNETIITDPQNLAETQNKQTTNITNYESENNTKQNQIKEQSAELEDKLIIQHHSNPKNTKVIQELIALYANRQKTDLVIHYWRKLQQLDYKISNIITEKYIVPIEKDYLNRIKTLERKNDFERMITEYTRLINLFPEKTKYYYEITLVYIKLDKLQTIKIQLFELISKFPNDPYINAALGEIYYKEDIFERAQKYFENSIQIFNEYPKPAISLINILSTLDLFEKAENILINIVEKHQNNIEVLHTAAKLYSKFYRPQKAVIYYKKLLEFIDNDILILISAAEQALLANDNKFAIKLSEQILTLDNTNINGWQLLSRAYTQAGDHISAYRCSEEIKKLRKY